MNLNDNIEGYETGSRVVNEGWDLARYGIRAWIDSETQESSRGQTTGDSVQKGGARVKSGPGQVNTYAQGDGYAVMNEPVVAGMSLAHVGLIALLAGGLLWAASD